MIRINQSWAGLAWDAAVGSDEGLLADERRTGSGGRGPGPADRGQRARRDADRRDAAIGRGRTAWCWCTPARLDDATQELLDHGASCVLLGLPVGLLSSSWSSTCTRRRPTSRSSCSAPEAGESDSLQAMRSGAQDHLCKSELNPVVLRRAVYARDRAQALRELQLAHQALHDALTGLPNRALFLDRLGVALDRSRRTSASVAVLFLDVDNFKDVNDSLGHAAGDRVLAALAERLQAMLRPMDTVARFGGDEFTFLFEELASEREVVLIAERISRVAGAPIPLEDGEASVTVSIGIAMVERPERAAGDRDPRGRRRDVPRQGARALTLRAVRRGLARARDGTPRARGGAAAGDRARASCASTTSRGSRSTAQRRSPDSRRSCAGSTPSAGCFGPTSSCRWPRRPGSCWRSASSCSSRRSGSSAAGAPRTRR